MLNTNNITITLKSIGTKNAAEVVKAINILQKAGEFECDAFITKPYGRWTNMETEERKWFSFRYLYDVTIENEHCISVLTKDGTKEYYEPVSSGTIWYTVFSNYDDYLKAIEWAEVESGYMHFNKSLFW